MTDSIKIKSQLHNLNYRLVLVASQFSSAHNPVADKQNKNLVAQLEVPMVFGKDTLFKCAPDVPSFGGSPYKSSKVTITPGVVVKYDSTTDSFMLFDVGINSSYSDLKVQVRVEVQPTLFNSNLFHVIADADAVVEVTETEHYPIEKDEVLATINFIAHANATVSIVHSAVMRAYNPYYKAGDHSTLCALDDSSPLETKLVNFNVL